MEEDSEPQAVGFQAPSGSPLSPKPTLSLLLIWENFREELTPQRPGKPSQAAGTRKSASPSHPTSYCHPQPRQQFPQGNMCCGGGSPASPPHHMLGAGAAAPAALLGSASTTGPPSPCHPSPSLGRASWAQGYRGPALSFFSLLLSVDAVPSPPTRPFSVGKGKMYCRSGPTQAGSGAIVLMNHAGAAGAQSLSRRH